MPVYLLTVHAYRSWHEDHPRGFVQHGHGLRASTAELAQWRKDAAKFDPVRFDLSQQQTLHAVIEQFSDPEPAPPDQAITAHGVATCPTHVHDLFSFRFPRCICGTAEHCRHDCPARRHAERFAARLKRTMGYGLACQGEVAGRPWLARGWNLTPVRQRDHFNYLMKEYLPDHQRTQGGLFRAYPLKVK